ncbi:hypothetical protein JHK85_027210 [Glycine max]|nr:hypothetical protein JHK85_027210 [Glycine max]KAG5002576.1 hypothetical protein JHK86_026715 [Glycine max]
MCRYQNLFHHSDHITLDICLACMYKNFSFCICSSLILPVSTTIQSMNGLHRVQDTQRHLLIHLKRGIRMVELLFPFISSCPYWDKTFSTISS